jgi:hypothetical protein
MIEASRRRNFSKKRKWAAQRADCDVDINDKHSGGTVCWLNMERVEAVTVVLSVVDRSYVEYTYAA